MALPKQNGPNPKPYSKRFLSKLYEHSKKTCLEQQMTKKIAVEVDAKICFGKKCKNMQVYLFNEDGLPHYIPW